MTARTTFPPEPLELQNGDEMSGAEFLTAYEAYPDETKFELVNGVVYMASPVKLAHGDGDSLLTMLVKVYQARTPGVHAASNATVLLSTDTVVQPDSFLRVRPEYGGRTTRSADGFVDGPPELVIEVSNSSRSIDLNAKRRAYAATGVREYFVLNIRGSRCHWFDLTTDTPRPIPDDGVCRSSEFPGLWINATAVVDDDLSQVLATLDSGLASPEHAAFVADLAARRTTQP